MKTIKKSNMVVIEGSSGADLQNKYNSSMDELTRAGITIEEKIISIEKMSAIILYEETVKIPECLKDEYALRGIYPRCSECPMYVQGLYGTGVCPRVKGVLRDDDDICKARWRELEAQLERRIYATQESTGRDEAQGDDSSAAC